MHGAALIGGMPIVRMAEDKEDRMTASASPSPIPDSYRRVTPCLTVRGAGRALEFYAAVFGATERMRSAGPGGTDPFGHGWAIATHGRSCGISPGFRAVMPHDNAAWYAWGGGGVTGWFGDEMPVQRRT